MANLIASCGEFVFVTFNRTNLVTLRLDGSTVSTTEFKAPIRSIGCIASKLGVSIEKQGESKENLFVYEISPENGALELLFSKALAHAAIQLFMKDSGMIVLNSGDLDEYDYETKDCKNLLGSIVAGTSFDVNVSGNLIISADRDARVRVSNYPNTYEIVSFAFCHEDFISCVVFTDDETFVSCDGDGQISVCGRDGKPTVMKRLYKEETVVRQLARFGGLVCAIAEGSNDVRVLNDQLECIETIEMPSQPLSMTANGDCLWVLTVTGVYCVTGGKVKQVLVCDELSAADYSLESMRVKSKRVIRKTDKGTEKYNVWRNPERHTSHKEE